MKCLNYVQLYCEEVVGQFVHISILAVGRYSIVLSVDCPVPRIYSLSNSPRLQVKRVLRTVTVCTKNRSRIYNIMY